MTERKHGNQFKLLFLSYFAGLIILTSAQDSPIPKPPVVVALCPEIYAPVCGSDGSTYENKCKAATAGIEKYVSGTCEELAATASATSDTKYPVVYDNNIICGRVYEPVCGSDGVSYPNDCEAKKAGVQIASKGECMVPVLAEKCSPGGPCSEGSSCAVGKQTCCGLTYDSLKCECMSGSWMCLVTEACMMPCADDTTTTTTSTTTTGDIMVTQSSGLCGKWHISREADMTCTNSGVGTIEPTSSCTGWYKSGEECCERYFGTRDCRLVDVTATTTEATTTIAATTLSCGTWHVSRENPKSCTNSQVGMREPTSDCTGWYETGEECCRRYLGRECPMIDVFADTSSTTSTTLPTLPLSPCVEWHIDRNDRSICTNSEDYPSVWREYYYDEFFHGTAEACCEGVENCRAVDVCASCPEVYAPVCGSDSSTYENECKAGAAGIEKYVRGTCEELAAATTTTTTRATTRHPDVVYDDIMCGKVYEPVCGSDGVSYPNDCEAEKAGVQIASKGECMKPDLAEKCSPGGPCSEGSSCAVGKETCCGQTYDSLKCECSSGSWMCLVTEACMMPCADDTTTTTTSTTTTGDIMVTQSSGLCGKWHVSRENPMSCTNSQVGMREPTSDCKGWYETGEECCRRYLGRECPMIDVFADTSSTTSTTLPTLPLSPCEEWHIDRNDRSICTNSEDYPSVWREYYYDEFFHGTAEACCEGVENCRAVDVCASCPEEYTPVCGSDGSTYENECKAAAAGIEKYMSGTCEELAAATTTTTTRATTRHPDVVYDDIMCGKVYEPVCGSDGVSYPNDCEAEKAGVQIASKGECMKPVLAEKCSPGGKCSEEGSYCAVGKETCCGHTYDSLKCECSNGSWMCLVTEACMMPCAPTFSPITITREPTPLPSHDPTKTPTSKPVDTTTSTTSTSTTTTITHSTTPAATTTSTTPNGTTSEPGDIEQNSDSLGSTTSTSTTTTITHSTTPAAPTSICSLQKGRRSCLRAKAQKCNWSKSERACFQETDDEEMETDSESTAEEVCTSLYESMTRCQEAGCVWKRAKARKQRCTSNPSSV